ncbi:MAG: hypothetical protein J6X18_06065 [Bacteroidales bacterium]|nr:hypothetical protein [Bacteroidales bacterium]
MTNISKNSDITQLREAVRRLVSERVYGMIRESMFEQYVESDDKNNTDSKEKTDYGDIKKSDAAKKRKQVTTMLRDPKINMAELGRDLYPEMSDDAARSLISKKSRGVRELTPDEIITLYQKLHTTKGN